MLLSTALACRQEPPAQPSKQAATAEEEKNAGANLPAKLPDSYRSLFNGRDLTGWKIQDDAPFTVQDGVIDLAGGRGALVAEGEYGDFDLHVEFRFLKEHADSGVFVRIREGSKYQVQTRDESDLGDVRSGPVEDKEHDDELTDRVRLGVGQWQAFDISLAGDRCEVRLNGQLVTTAKGLAKEPGQIGLQAEGHPLEFRNIQIRAK